ncbi:DUF2975 domain-containing protein [Lapidilactobacillus wuchangensis]|uniref:DUF2975 domain-containing protein n=1 Tax=Lapidilactobacillus wuchangensis TaxID=2486001 RepID=UPI000F797D50|nr:DUF2975 domain-containing protein [Lapidilactobacillus wuchangensis]
MKIKTLYLKIILGLSALFIAGYTTLLTIIMINSPDERALFTDQVFFEIALYLTAFISWAAIYFAYRILRLIDQQKAFTTANLHFLRQLRYLAISETIVAIGLAVPFFHFGISGMPFAFLLGFTILLIPIIIAAVIAVAEKLLVQAIQLQSDSDLLL